MCVVMNQETAYSLMLLTAQAVASVKSKPTLNIDILKDILESVEKNECGGLRSFRSGLKWLPESSSNPHGGPEPHLLDLQFCGECEFRDGDCA